MYRRFGKRAFDLVLTIPAIGLLSPVLAALAILVFLSLGRPVLFRQRRPGRDGRPFTILKFRSMTDGRDAAGRLLPDAARLTRLGRFLRRTSLDELPELFNVLRGDMSLVGPRPLVLGYLPYFTERERKRHDLLPGLTGWAQINGRNNLPWDARLACDVWYVENCAWWLDVSILFRTIFKVLRGDGVEVDSQRTVMNLDAERSGTTVAAGCTGSMDRTGGERQ